jgi:hypothetical protein
LLIDKLLRRQHQRVAHLLHAHGRINGGGLRDAAGGRHLIRWNDGSAAVAAAAPIELR